MPGAWQEQRLVPGYSDDARGAGAADLVIALAFHVLGTMAALHAATVRRKSISVRSHWLMSGGLEGSLWANVR